MNNIVFFRNFNFFYQANLKQQYVNKLFLGNFQRLLTFFHDKKSFIL